MHSESKLDKDFYGGGLLAVIGLGSALWGRRYGMGTLAHMGPGFFPVAVGVALALAGAGIAFRAAVPRHEEKKPEQAAAERPDWRGWCGIVGGLAAFGVLGAYAGLVPATIAVALLPALGDRQNTAKEAVWLAVAMALISIVVFRWGLQIQIPLFR